MTGENKALLRRVPDEVFNARNLDRVNELFAEDYVMYDPDAPGEVAGVDGMKAYIKGFLDAFSDLRIDVVDQLSEGDKVATRYVVSGTHDGDLMGIAPTGRRVEATGIIISRFDGGKIAEEWQVFGTLAMMQQLGAVAASG